MSPIAIWLIGAALCFALLAWPVATVAALGLALASIFAANWFGPPPAI